MLIHQTQFLQRSVIALAALLAATAVAGCGDSDEVAGSTASTGASGATSGVVKKPGATDKTVATVPVQKVSGSGGKINPSKPRLIVIKSQKQLDRFLAKVNSGQQQPIQLGASDFAGRQIVAVVIPEQSPGTQLAISEVKPRNTKRFVVKAVYLPPGKGCKSSGSSEPVFTIVETDKMDGKGKLSITKQRQSPC